MMINPLFHMRIKVTIRAFFKAIWPMDINSY
jgi:hypothetical protein